MKPITEKQAETTNIVLDYLISLAFWTSENDPYCDMINAISFFSGLLPEQDRICAENLLLLLLDFEDEKAS